MQFLTNTIWFTTGYRNYGKSGFARNSRKFNAADLDVKLNGKDYLITGANSGIGKEAAIELAKKGGRVHLLCRNKERGEEALADVIQLSGNDSVELHLLDVSDLTAISDFATKWNNERGRAHCLINNAGVMPEKRQETKEGFELTYATNLLGTFLLTQMLLPSLNRAALELKEPSKVITVSSGGMFTQKLDVKNIESVTGEYNGTNAYAQTKRAQVYFNMIWSDLYKDKLNIEFYCMHPGWCVTPAVQSSMPQFYEKLGSMMRSAGEGADTIVWLSCHNAPSGKFYFDREVQRIHLPLSSTNSPPGDVLAMWRKCLQDSKWTPNPSDFADPSIIESIQHDKPPINPSAL